MFVGGYLFIDHATNFVHVKFQKHLNTAETLKAKEKSEAFSRDYGVIAESYLSDNARCFLNHKMIYCLGRHGPFGDKNIKKRSVIG